MEQEITRLEADTTDAADAADDDIVEELLIEEISIDGMCGVY
ncbi:MAG: mycofactocin precursor MftA [Ilumatobacter sp.]|nr:mycofactocin precursor MftA [Ilumatobacter sp.]MDJ0771179.1 mycofactocin precursor MftA [Ilumatobacter sp.]